MIEVGLIVLSLIYGFIFIYQSHNHRKERIELLEKFNTERTELLDRLMAKSYAEYEGYKDLRTEHTNNREPNNFLQKSIRDAYRAQRGPFDDEETMKFIEK